MSKRKLLKTFSSSKALKEIQKLISINTLEDKHLSTEDICLIISNELNITQEFDEYLIPPLAETITQLMRFPEIKKMSEHNLIVRIRAKYQARQDEETHRLQTLLKTLQEVEQDWKQIKTGEKEAEICLYSGYKRLKVLLTAEEISEAFPQAITQSSEWGDVKPYSNYSKLLRALSFEEMSATKKALGSCLMQCSEELDHLENEIISAYQSEVFDEIHGPGKFQDKMNRRNKLLIQNFRSTWKQITESQDRRQYLKDQQEYRAFTQGSGVLSNNLQEILVEGNDNA